MELHSQPLIMFSLLNFYLFDQVPFLKCCRENKVPWFCAFIIENVYKKKKKKKLFNSFSVALGTGRDCVLMVFSLLVHHPLRRKLGGSVKLF